MRKIGKRLAGAGRDFDQASMGGAREDQLVDQPERLSDRTGPARAWFATRR
jgi:hypothetical protein